MSLIPSGLSGQDAELTKSPALQAVPNYSLNITPLFYCIYFPLFAVALGLAGKFHGKKSWIPILVGTVMTPLLTLTDNVVTPLMTGLRGLRWRLYVYHSLPVVGAQTICALVTLIAMYVPLKRVFFAVAKRVKAKNPREKERKIS